MQVVDVSSFFSFFPRSIVESVMCSGSFMCVFQFPFDYFSVLSILSASLSCIPKKTLPKPSLT